MKKIVKYVIFSLSLVLAFSLILDSFADDYRNRKRHRYRWGHQEVGDDNNGKDYDHFKPVSNLTYREICGECHFAYQPELLPSASWLNILGQLDDHFGEEIEVIQEKRKNISDYLVINGAEKSSAEHARKIMRCLGNQVPMRITDIPYIRGKHQDLSPTIFERKSIGSFSNCTSCHVTAEEGIYEDDNVRIPQS
jgi:hypothetical protein